MRNKVIGVVSAAALLASVGVANAKGPVKLSDVQLDKVTAGGPGRDFHGANIQGGNIHVGDLHVPDVRVSGFHGLTH
jgi:hypothetical protein